MGSWQITWEVFTDRRGNMSDRKMNPKHMKRNLDMWVAFENISSLEAMSMIDQNDIENLYFVEKRREMVFMPNGFARLEDQLTDPIRFGSEIIIETGRTYFFKFKKIKAAPKKISDQYIEHYWFKRTKSL